MIVELTLLGFIIRYIKDKNFKFLDEFNLKNIKFLLSGLIVKLFIINFFNTDFLTRYYYLIDAIFLLVISFFFFSNGKIFAISGLGTMLNAVVVLLNKKMPVAEKFAHLVMDNSKYEMIKNGNVLTHGFINNPKLRIFSDIIPIPKPYIYPRLISVGDILISIGIFIFILSSKEN